MYLPIPHLVNESRSMLTRLSQVKPFSLTIPMVPAASISHSALSQIDQFLYKGKSELRHLITNYLSWLGESVNSEKDISEAQGKFSRLKMRFNNILTQVDIFADVLNQRSEQNTGIRISALDLAAEDALKLPGHYYEIPPVICYIERGYGAAIRRVHTRLPGGKENPVAVIRVPRERMVGSGIGSSLFHEAGHQGAALLDLVRSLRREIGSRTNQSQESINTWVLWSRWISEIIADFWSISQLGISATLGLIGVVSLPRVFVFRISASDPHPFPWIRVKIGCAIGNALYPHPQWQELSRLWDCLYPIKGLNEAKQKIISDLLRSLPDFISLLMNHRPKSIFGDSLGNVFSFHNRTPEILKSNLKAWRSSPGRIFTQSPAQVFAVIGQGKADGHIGPEQESLILTDLLKHWALNSTVYTAVQGSYRQKESINKFNKLLLV